MMGCIVFSPGNRHCFFASARLSHKRTTQWFLLFFYGAILLSKGLLPPSFTGLLGLPFGQAAFSKRKRDVLAKNAQLYFPIWPCYGPMPTALLLLPGWSVRRASFPHRNSIISSGFGLELFSKTLFQGVVLTRRLPSSISDST